jgi:hypothetical protein
VVKDVDFKPLAPHRCGFISRQGLWIHSCEEIIQLAYRTSMVLLRTLFVPEIMHWRATEVKLEVATRHKLCRCDVKQTIFFIKSYINVCFLPTTQTDIVEHLSLKRKTAIWVYKEHL